MSEPTLTVTGQEIYDALAPIMTQDPQNGYAGATLSGALATFLDPVSDVVRDQPDGTPGFGILFNPDGLVANGMASWLPWVSQFVGDSAAVVAAPTPQAQAALIKAPQNFVRGRPATLIAAAQSTLTGTKTVTLNQFYGSDPNTVQLVTYSNETPNPTATQNAVLAVSCAWQIINFQMITGVNYAALADSHSTYSQMEAAHTTYADIASNPSA